LLSGVFRIISKAILPTFIPGSDSPKGRPQKWKPHAAFHQHSPQPRALGTQYDNAGKYENASRQDRKKQAGNATQDKNSAKCKYDDALERIVRFCDSGHSHNGSPVLRIIAGTHVRA